MRKTILLLTLLFLSAFPSLFSYAGDYQEEGSGTHDPGYSLLVITSTPLEGVSGIEAVLKNEKGENTEITIEPDGHTKLYLPSGNYRLCPEISPVFDTEHGILSDIPLEFKAVSSDPVSMNVTVTETEAAFLGTEENPVSFLFIYKENKESAGILTEPFTSAGFLMEDIRLTPYGSSKSQALPQQLPVPDDYYKESMAAYIKEICERENIPLPDDEKIQSFGGYGNDPYGEAVMESTSITETEAASLSDKEEVPSFSESSGIPNSTVRKGKKTVLILFIAVFGFLSALFAVLCIFERRRRK